LVLQSLLQYAEFDIFAFSVNMSYFTSMVCFAMTFEPILLSKADSLLTNQTYDVALNL